MTDINTQIIGYEAGEDLVAGDIVYLNTDGEAVKVAAVEATTAIGIVYSDADEGSMASIIVVGLVDACHLFVEDTDGSSGYDSAIGYGDQLIISGKTAGTYGVGQALSAVGGTAQTTSVEGMVVGKALVIVAGSAAADTYTTGKVYVNFMS